MATPTHSLPDGFDPDAPLAEQAQFWVIALHADTLSDADHDYFTAWLDASEAHGAAFLDAQLFWRAIGERTPATPPFAQRRPWLRRVGVAPLALAACVAAGLVAITLYAPRIEPTMSAPVATATLATGIGEIREEVLEDGTRVTLSPDSRLQIAMGPDARAAALDRGEAFFEVSRDETRPFTVASGASQARVLGTSFNVRNTPQAVTVSVLSGRVEVRSSSAREAGRALVLGPGEATDVGADGRLGSARGFVPSQALAWRDRRFYFANAPLSDVVRELNRFSQKPIELQGGDIADLRVSVSFSLAQREDTLNGLADTFLLDIVETPEKTIMSASRDQ